MQAPLAITRRRGAGGIAILLIACLALFGLSASASAQTAAGADEYIPAGPIDFGGDTGVQGDSGEGGPTGADDGDGDGLGSSSPSTATSTDGGGDLPFTGYPLTSLVLLCLALLLAGLLLRLALALYDRHRSSAEAT